MLVDANDLNWQSVLLVNRFKISFPFVVTNHNTYSQCDKDSVRIESVKTALSKKIHCLQRKPPLVLNSILLTTGFNESLYSIMNRAIVHTDVAFTDDVQEGRGR